MRRKNLPEPVPDPARAALVALTDTRDLLETLDEEEDPEAEAEAEAEDPPATGGSIFTVGDLLYFRFKKLSPLRPSTSIENLDSSEFLNGDGSKIE